MADPKRVQLNLRIDDDDLRRLDELHKKRQPAATRSSFSRLVWRAGLAAAERDENFLTQDTSEKKRKAKR